MNEIWGEGEIFVIYTEDAELATYLKYNSCVSWFGTYTKGKKWIAEQYHFPASEYENIAKRADLPIK